MELNLLPNLYYKSYWLNTKVENWSIETFDIHWIQNNPNSHKKRIQAHSSLGDELSILVKVTDQNVANKAKLLQNQLKNGGISEITDIIWSRSDEIAKSQVHLTLSELLAKSNIKTTIINEISSSETGKRPLMSMKDNDVSGDDEPSEGKEDQSLFSESEESAVDLPQKQNDMTPKRKPEDVEEEDDIYDIFEVTAQGVRDSTLIVKGTDVRERMEGWHKKSKYVSEIHKQDLLRYNIIDTISSSATNARRLFEDIWETMVIAMEEVTSTSITKDDKIKNYAKELFMGVNSLEKLRGAIKSNRSTLRTSGNIGWKRQIIKISKIFRDQFENGKNSFKEKQTEYQYIIYFIAPIYKILFKDLLHLSFDWGEKSLKCSAILLNKSQRDNDRRSPGSKIDTIIKLMELSLEFSVVEVSGSPSDPDHSHYVGDRNKIAKNLKIILNYIRTKYPGDFQQFRKIKVYGVQIYNNFFYLYSLSLPFSGVYYFKQEFMFECPTITLLASKALPKFLDNLWRIRDIISSSAESITSYLENMKESDDDGSNDIDPVTISPKKQRQK